MLQIAPRPARSATLVAAAFLCTSEAFADCTCRAFGRDFELGRSVCMATPDGFRLATCGMVLNNTSWRFSTTPCVVSAAPPATAPARDGTASPATGGLARHAHRH